MKSVLNYKVIIVILGLIILIICQVFQSIRIEQLKDISPLTIKAIGEYEEKSKTEYNIKVDSIFKD